MVRKPPRKLEKNHEPLEEKTPRRSNQGEKQEQNKEPFEKETPLRRSKEEEEHKKRTSRLLNWKLLPNTT